MSDYYFNEDHKLFRESLRDFLNKEVHPNVDQWEEERKIPRTIWEKMGAMGYLGLNYPEAYGGQNLDFFYSVVFVEEIAKCWSGGFSIALAVQAYMSSTYIFHHGTEAVKQKYLTPAIQGKKICSIAITEPNAGSDVANIRTTAKKEGDHYIVNGSKTFITNAVYGDVLIVVCKTDTSKGFNGFSLILMDRNAEGVSATKLKKMGWHASDTAELAFDNVKVPAENLLGEEGQGFIYLMNGLQLERLVGAVLAIGGIDAAMAYTLNYMSEREAFGRPINRFQVLRHRIAQLATEQESMRHFVYHTCRMHNDGQYAVKEASMCKLLASELSDKAAYQLLQMFGGYGYMEEYKMARFFRDSRIGTIGGGSSEIMREIISKMIIDDKSYVGVNEENNGQVNKPVIAKEIILGLANRFKSEKAAELIGNYQFNISGTNGGQFSVLINRGELKVEEGLQGEANCLVEVEDTVYEGVETGTINPQVALMKGDLKVSDLGEMMKFSSLFRRYK